MIKKYSAEFTFIGLVLALLVWFGVKPSSFKLIIFEQIPSWLFRIALILLIFWVVYITVKIRKLLKTGSYYGVIDRNSTQHELAKVKLSKKEKEFEYTENQLFILALIVESGRDSITSLFNSYKKQFPEARLIEIKYIANLLKNNGLIRRTGIVGGNLLYVPTDKVIERVFKESEKMKNYAEAIEEHKEMSEKAKMF